MKKLINLLKSRNTKALLGTIIGTVIYSFGVAFILDKSKMYANGITGISQLVKTIVGSESPYFLSIMILILNIPLFLIAMKGVSKRFAILSFSSVILQFVLTALFSVLLENGFDPFNQFNPETDKLTLALLGGFFSGFGCGICLRYGASTGGTDVLSQYLSLNKQVNFAKFSFTINCLIVVGSVFADIKNGIDISTAVYTIINMFISILVLDKIHTIYKYNKITIVTVEKQRMRDALVKLSNHGVTIFECIGGFSNKTKYMLEIVVWSFETSEYVRRAKEIDPACFITYSDIKRVEGTFNINVIA